MGIARSYLALGEYEKAVTAFEHALGEHPRSIYVLENRVGLEPGYERLGRLEDATAMLERTI